MKYSDNKHLCHLTVASLQNHYSQKQMEEKNYISNFDCSLWQIDDWGLYTAKSPIYINSLGS